MVMSALLSLGGQSVGGAELPVAQAGAGGAVPEVRTGDVYGPKRMG